MSKSLITSGQIKQVLELLHARNPVGVCAACKAVGSTYSEMRRYIKRNPDSGLWELSDWYLIDIDPNAPLIINTNSKPRFRIASGQVRQALELLQSGKCKRRRRAADAVGSTYAGIRRYIKRNRESGLWELSEAYILGADSDEPVRANTRAKPVYVTSKHVRQALELLQAGHYKAIAAVAKEVGATYTGLYRYIKYSHESGLWELRDGYSVHPDSKLPVNIDTRRLRKNCITSSKVRRTLKLLRQRRVISSRAAAKEIGAAHSTLRTYIKRNPDSGLWELRDGYFFGEDFEVPVNVNVRPPKPNAARITSDQIRRVLELLQSGDYKELGEASNAVGSTHAGMLRYIKRNREIGSWELRDGYSFRAGCKIPVKNKSCVKYANKERITCGQIRQALELLRTSNPVGLVKASRSAGASETGVGRYLEYDQDTRSWALSDEYSVRYKAPYKRSSVDITQEDMEWMNAGKEITAQRKERIARNTNLRGVSNDYD